MKLIINFHGSESEEYEVDQSVVDEDETYFYIATSRDEGQAVPKENIESIKIISEESK